MVGRVLLDTNGLRVSKPGAEVTTATSDDLLFNSNSGKYLAPVLKGQISPSSYYLINSNYGTTTSFERWEYTLWFGQTFANPPALLVRYRDYATTDGSLDNYNVSLTNTAMGGSGAVIYIFTNVDAIHYALTDRAIFQIEYYWASGYGAPKIAGPQVISYVVGRYG